MSDISRDPDELYDDDVTFAIRIEVMGDGGLKVSGDYLGNKTYALAVIDAAKGAVKNHHARGNIFPPSYPTVVKPDEVVEAIDIKCRRNGNMSTGGSINNLDRALLILDHARTAIIEHHNRILQGTTVVVPPKDTDFGERLGGP